MALKVVAVPVSSSADVITAFMSCAERQNIELREIPTFSDLKQVPFINELLTYFVALLLDPGAVEFCRLTALNFHGVKLIG